MSIVRVAAKAGVSSATVSRVINRRPGVSPEIRRAVREAIKLLGYRPSPPEHRPGPRLRDTSAARKRSAGTVAILLVNEVYRYSPGLCLASLRGVQREAADHGWATVTAFLGEDQRIPAVVRSADAAVIMGSGALPRLLGALRKLPHVWLTSHHDPSGASAMEGNHEIARLACEYLLGRGHRRLAFIAVTSSYPAFSARAKSMEFFASTRGATVDVLTDEDDWARLPLPDFNTLQERMDALIDRFAALSPRPTGVFVGNDAMAAMCYRSMRQRQIEPLRDVEVISCNNDAALLLGLVPRPATIDLGSELLGRRSFEQLLRSLRRPEESRRVRIAISPQLVPGEEPSLRNP